MLSVDQEVFIRIPQESTARVLHPGNVVAIEETFVVQFEEPEIQVLQAPSDVLLYFNHQREFMQQPARIESVDAEPDVCPQATVQLQGEPVSAESRQCYRVSTVLAEIDVEVNDKSCPLLDISINGFAIKSSEKFAVGEKQEITIEFEGKKFSGIATLQSIKDLGAGEYRYGYYCTEKACSSLMKGLQQTSLDFQRQQLKRMAGTS